MKYLKQLPASSNHEILSPTPSSARTSSLNNSEGVNLDASVAAFEVVQSGLALSFELNLTQLGVYFITKGLKKKALLVCFIAELSQCARSQTHIFPLCETDSKTQVGFCSYCQDAPACLIGAPRACLPTLTSSQFDSLCLHITSNRPPVAYLSSLAPLLFQHVRLSSPSPQTLHRINQLPSTGTFFLLLRTRRRFGSMATAEKPKTGFSRHLISLTSEKPQLNAPTTSRRTSTTSDTLAPWPTTAPCHVSQTMRRTISPSLPDTLLPNLQTPLPRRVVSPHSGPGSWSGKPPRPL